MKTFLRSILAAFALAIVGCATVHQDEVDNDSAGFYVPPKPVTGGYIVDAAFRDRYNGLVAIYGKKKLENGAPIFVPPLRKDDGLTKMNDDTWFMTEAAMEDMVILNDMKRRGSAP